MSTRRRRPMRPGPWTPGMAVIVVIAVVLASLAVVLVVLAPGPPGPAPYSYVNGTVSSGPVLSHVSHSFWSMNVASPDLTDPGVEALVTATGVTYVNTGFPAEAVNQSSGVEYTSSGTTVPFTGETDATFIQFCQRIGCHATMPLPGEIDDPGAAAVTVRYVEQTLGFTPLYWEVGNEPIAWSHFGIPWTHWQSTDHSAPTPLQYALMVQAYILAVRSVDPLAQFVGIQSDAGAPADSNWFTALMQLDGAELAAVAYHSYAGGTGFSGNGPGDFFATLTKPQTFPLNYAATVAVVRAACLLCTTQVFVGEYNSALEGNMTQFAAGYPEAPYIAAGLLEALKENATQVTFYALQPGTGAGLLDGQGNRQPVSADYTVYFPNLTMPWIDNATIAGGPLGEYVLLSHNSTAASLFVVNTNVSFGLRLTLGSGLAFGGVVRVYLDGPRLAGPTVGTELVNTTTTFEVPPEGILLVDGPLPPGLLPASADVQAVTGR